MLTVIRIGILTLLTMLLASNVFAVETVKIIRGQSTKDARVNYKQAILKAALDHTIEEYGPYEIDANYGPFRRRIGLEKMIEGVVDVYYAPANPEWERFTHPIYIPIRKGLLNYRLLMVNKTDLHSFKSVESYKDLKRFKVGLREQWTTTQIMKALDFTVVAGTTYDDIFTMLNEGKSEFIPRGVNEVFGEIEAYGKDLSNLTIEPRLALYLPMPVYIYVSPKRHGLAVRIEKGLNMMIADGSFETLFMKYYGESIKRAKLSDRHIIRLSNPFLTKETPLSRKELWYTPKLNDN